MDDSSVEMDRSTRLCYYYYPTIAYWIIVCSASAVILLISYLSLYAICCKSNPFRKCSKKQNLDEHSTEQEIQRRNIECIIRFYQFMFAITVVLLVLSVTFSTVVSELCFKEITNMFEEQYIAAVLILVSYVMVSLTLNLLWFSTQNHKVCNLVAIMFVIAVLIHFGGIAILCYWMKMEQPVEGLHTESLEAVKEFYTNTSEVNTTAIAMMAMIAVITYSTFWVFICKIFNYKFCGCRSQSARMNGAEMKTEGNPLTVTFV